MKSRTKLAAATLLLFSVLALFIYQTNRKFVHQYFPDDTVFLMTVLSIAAGAFGMFLLFSFLPRTVQNVQRMLRPAPQSYTGGILNDAVSLKLGEQDPSEFSDSDQSWFSLTMAGDALRESGDYQKAASLYRKALAKVSGRPRAFVLMALARLNEEEGAEDYAEQNYLEVIRVAPSAWRAAVGLRNLYVRREEWQSALSWQEYLEQHSPDDLNTDEEKMLRLGVRYEMASRAFEEDASGTAIALCKHILRLDSAFVPAYRLLGEIYTRTGHHSAGLRVMQKGFRLTLHPVLIQASAESFLRRNMPDAAISFVLRSLLRFPQVTELKLLLGDLYRRFELNSEALQVFENFERENPGWSICRVRLAKLYSRDGRYDKAAALYEAVLRDEDPVNPWACYNCHTTSDQYPAFCPECLMWNTYTFNSSLAGRIEKKYAQSQPSRLP